MALFTVFRRSNGLVEEVLVDDERIALDDGINVDTLLFRLSRRLGFDYVSENGDWNEDGEWIPAKKR